MEVNGNDKETELKLLKKGDAEEEAGYRERDIMCGVGSCKTPACANMKAFSALLSFILFCHIGMFTYGIGVLRTVEKRFDLRSSETGLLLSLGDAVQTAIVILVGYFGSKAHKPRVVSVSIVFTGVSSILCATPYFIYGPKPIDSMMFQNPIHSGNASLETSGYSFGQNGVNFQMCQTGNGTNMSDSVCVQTEEVKLEMERYKSAYLIFVFASLLLGVGMSGLGTLGISYLDENVNKEDSGLYIGVVSSMYAWGPIVGFTLAGVTTRMPEDLGEQVLSPYHPAFIGCWWLGYFIFGILIICASIPMFLFPKHLEAYYRVYKIPRKQKQRRENRIQKEYKNPIQKHLREFPVSLWRLVSDPAFVCLILSLVCSLYVVVGIILNLPRYMEIHFGQPAFMANVMAGLSGALAGATGNIIGGIFMKKMKLKPLGSAWMYVGAIFIALTGNTIMMLLGCPQPHLPGQKQPSSNILNLDIPCNADCGCSADVYQPVCSSDGATYMSACFAGCAQSQNNTFHDCSCVADEVEVTFGACSAPCNMIIAYMVVFFVTSFLSSVGRVPSTILLFRIVPEELKALALGIVAFLINLVVFMPGPMLFGFLFDSACMVWKSSCGSTGACMHYDITKFRFYMHGVTLCFQGGAFVLAFATLYFVRKRFRGKDEEDGEEEKRKPIVKETDNALLST